MVFTDLKEFLDAVTNWRIPGADCAVYYENKQVFRYAAGFADAEKRRPLTADNLYFLYSATKVITCTAALQLLEKGRYLLNDPVSAYLPEFAEMHIRTVDNNGTPELVQAKKPITIRNLFTMTAGLSYDLDSPAIQKVRETTQGRCPTRETIRAVAAEPLLFEPGTHWNYSLCHDVLGCLVEVISGKRFGAYIREHILDPLGMKETGFDLTEGKKPRLATQYRFNDSIGKAEAIPPINNYRLGSEYESGGAGLISSVDDYITFANTLCNGGRALNGEQILSRSTIDLMRTNQLDEALQKDFNWAQMAGYGYGLGVRTMIDRAKGGSLSPPGEFGWGGAAGSYVIIDLENRLALFYAQHMLNNQEPYVHPRIRNIVYHCLGS